MPFYPDLRIFENNSPALKAKKKRTATNILVLKNQLQAHLEDSGSIFDQDKTVRIATWNLREFGASNYGGRDNEPIHYIAEIISHFDIVALQEIRTNLSDFNTLMRYLGDDWDYIASDITEGDPGNGERMVFLYKRRQVSFRNIAGELTLKEGSKIRAAFGERIKLEGGITLKLPPGAPSLSGVYRARTKKVKAGRKLDTDLEIPLPPGCVLELPDGVSLAVTKNTLVTSAGWGKAEVTIPDTISGKTYRLRFPENSFDDSLKQFARTPYLLSFQSGWLKLNLCTVHILYGDSSDKSLLEQRRSEIEQLTAALAEKAEGEFKQDDKSFLGVLGDFNIIGKGHPTMDALESNGFLIPEALKKIPGSNVEKDKAYDQIAFWEPNRDAGYARLEVLAANVFDFFEYVYTYNDEDDYRMDANSSLADSTTYKTWRTYMMSDHLPMWIELRTDFSDTYLKDIETG